MKNNNPSTIFFFDPGKRLSEAIAAFICSVPWLLIEIKYRDWWMVGLAGSVIAVSLFFMYHNAKWVFRRFREFLS